MQPFLKAFCILFAGSTAGSQPGDLRATNSTSALLSNGPLSGIGPVGQSSPNTTSPEWPLLRVRKLLPFPPTIWILKTTLALWEEIWVNTKEQKSAKTFLQVHSDVDCLRKPSVSQKPAGFSPVNDTCNVSRGTTRLETSFSFIYFLVAPKDEGTKVMRMFLLYWYYYRKSMLSIK